MTSPHSLPPPVRMTRGQSLATPSRAMAGSIWGGGGSDDSANEPLFADDPGAQPAQSAPKPGATDLLGRRAGALSDELDFPEFVASLIHGTWDAMVDSSIRQMDSYADLVAAVAKPIEQFKEENVTPNQVRDWLVAQYPADLLLARDSVGFSLQPRARAETPDEPPAPEWLAEFGLPVEPLSPELIEEQLIPAARDRMARDRMQTLATMVMLGMNRIVVKDGSITARLRFRASAADKTSVDYAVSDDPGSATPTGSWGTRGSTSYSAPMTKVSTVGVNAQTDSNLNAELFGEVKINFASETIPLERFVDDAKRTMLERAARPAPIAVAAPAAPPAAAAPAAAPVAPVSAAPASLPPAAPPSVPA